MFRSQKTPSAGIMQFWKTKAKSAEETIAQSATEASGSAFESRHRGQHSDFMPGYVRLEQRTLLSATFMTFGTTDLVLNDFDAGQDLDFAQQDAVVDGTVQDSYVFTVDSGSFTGDASSPFIELESVNGGIDNQLEVATQFFQGAANAQLAIDGLTSTGAFVEFTQTSPELTFDTLELSNFANDNRDLSLTATGDVTLDNVTVFDGDLTDGVTTPASLDVSVTGNLNLDGLTGNLSSDPNANVDLSATGNINTVVGSELTSEQNIDVTSINGSVTLADVSADGDVQVLASNNIVQRTGTEITGSDVTLSSTNGSITLEDVTADNLQAVAFNNLTQRISSDIVVGSSVDITATNGFTTLADITAGDQIQVSALNDITQIAGTELSGSDVTLSSTGGSITLEDVTADNLQVVAFNNITQRISSDIVVGSSVDLTATNGFATLADITAGDEIQVSALNDITQIAGTELSAAEVTLSSTSGAITLADVSATDELQLQAFNDIVQQTNSDITVGTTATVSSTSGNILLAAAPDQTVDVQGQANFNATEIEIGLDGEIAGSPAAFNVQLGSVNLNASRAVLVEDDSTLLTGDSSVTDLFISSAQDLNNTPGASLNSTNAQLNSATDIVLGNQAGDSILIGEVSLIANNAHLEVDGDLVINGVQPSAASIQPIALGTSIDQTLFVIADGSVEQTQGDLLAQQIGIEATEFVHLTSVAATNEAIAISAGGSAVLTDPGLSSTLNTLAAVENGEVDATAPQAIAVGHRGDAVVTNVTSVTGIDSLTGLTSTDGSISVFADQSISLAEDITAFGPDADPQITLFSAAGDSNNPTVFFNGGEATVLGPTNFGVVNANQVFTNFLDTDGFLFDGTTQVLTLNPDGTATQNFEFVFGSPGEEGLRVGFVFDSQNEVLDPVEDLNLFTPSNTVDSEAFEDFLFQNNTVIRALISGEGGRLATFTKIDDFTAAAIIDHFDDPNVFTDITVRNDQDINLFSGSLDSVDNSLNESFQQLLAVLDLPRGSVLPAPAINMVNEIQVRASFDLPFDSPPPLDQTTSIFDREVAPFESGELRWVQVKIPIEDLELVGDEVILKQPTLIYPAADDAVEMEFENVGENETDRIANQIERSPAAEPGYWYRIFKAYENRDDELIFYYYKTGEVDNVPAESAEGENILPDEKLENSIENEAPKPDAFEPEPDSETGRNDFSSHPTDIHSGTNPSQSVAASTLLMGLLRRETRRNQLAEDPSVGDIATGDSTISDENVPSANSAESYDRLSRLKRKLKRCL